MKGSSWYPVPGSKYLLLVLVLVVVLGTDWGQGMNCGVPDLVSWFC